MFFVKNRSRMARHRLLVIPLSMASLRMYSFGCARTRAMAAS